MISHRTFQEYLKDSRISFVETENGNIISKSSERVCGKEISLRNPYSYLLKSQREALFDMRSGEVTVIDLPKRAKLGRTLVLKGVKGYTFLFPRSLSLADFIPCSVINEKALPVIKTVLPMVENGKKLPDIFRTLSERVFSVCDIPLDVFLRVASSTLRFLCGDDMLTVTGNSMSLCCTPETFYSFGVLCSELLLSDNSGKEYRAEVEINANSTVFYLDGLKISEAEEKRPAFSAIRPYLFSLDEELGALILALSAELSPQ